MISPINQTDTGNSGVHLICKLSEDRHMVKLVLLIRSDNLNRLKTVTWFRKLS